MKKRLSVISLLLCVALLLGACGQGPAQPAPNNEPAAPAPGSSAPDNAGAAVDAEHPLQVRALDARTLEVTLNARTPYFLELTAFPTYMPVKRDIVEANGDAWATVPETYIGNGPYKTSEWVPGSSLTMVKNENYWDAANVGPASIVFRQISDDVPQLNGYQTNELQFIDSVPTGEVASLKSNPEFHVEAQLGTYYISLNNQVAPFDNPLVRKAFSLAVDRKYLADVIGEGLWLPATAWIPEGMMDGANDFRTVGGDYIDNSDYAANLAEAKAALAEAGYPNGEGLPVIEYIHNEGSIHGPVAEALQNMWGELGATVNVSMMEWTTFLETRKNGEYMAARDGWLNDYGDPIGMLDLFITGSGNNNSQYRNADYDALITQSKLEADPAARMALLHQAEDTLMDEWVFAPLLYYSDIYMVKPELANGFYSTPLGMKYFMNVKGVENLNVCLGSNDNTMDPAINSSVDGASMIFHAFEGLYRWNINNEVEPACAESVAISDDGLTYTFTLREGLTWSDGSPITAEDFVYAWTRAVDPNTAADYGYMFEVIAGYAEATA